MKTLLSARELGFSHGATDVFSGINFTVSAAERLAVLGVSGAGKTTLLRLVAGLERPSAGAIERAPNLTVGMVFQDLALWPNLTVFENVALAVHSLPKLERRAAVLAALEHCHVASFAARRPDGLSIGQQQRVALARSIAARPDVLLLDEPFTSLDLVLKQELFATVRALTADRALVLVTHDPLEALALCETALVLEAGSVVEHGPLCDLMALPQSQLLRLFREQLSRGNK